MIQVLEGEVYSVMSVMGLVILRPGKHKEGSEAPGRSTGNGPLGKVLVIMTDNELENELPWRKLDKEQQLLEKESSINVVTETVGLTLLLDVSIEGVPVASVADTGARSTIISRSMFP